MGTTSPLRIELKYIIGTLKLLVPIAGVIFLVRVVAMDFSTVDKTSMVPTLRQGDIILVEKFSGLFSDYSRGDIVQIFNPETKAILVKRIIGLPGEIVSSTGKQTYVVSPSGEKQKINEAVFVPNQRAFTSRVLREQEYFVLGDNRQVSIDSRDFGPVSRSLIIGRIAAAWKMTK